MSHIVKKTLRYSHTKRTQCPTARRNCASSLTPAAYSSHKRRRRSCSFLAARERVGDTSFPTACLSTVADASAASAWRASISANTLGWQWPTKLRSRLFQPSATLFVRWPSSSVAALTFHSAGGNRGGVCRTRFSPLLVCIIRELPFMYVSSKYSTRWMAFAGAMLRSHTIPSATSVTGRKASASSMPQKRRRSSSVLYATACTLIMILPRASTHLKLNPALVCTSLQIHASTPPLSFLPAGCPYLLPVMSKID